MVNSHRKHPIADIIKTQFVPAFWSPDTRKLLVLLELVENIDVIMYLSLTCMRGKPTFEIVNKPTGGVFTVL